MLVDGELGRLPHARTTRATPGVAVIYQEPTLFPDLSVAENVSWVITRSAPSSASTAARCTRGSRSCSTASASGSTPSGPCAGLSIADQQIVEIAKALSFDARVLIMDEPTAALSGAEVERLFKVVRTLRERGAAVLFISHRLDEIFSICDTVTVMRDGDVMHDARIADMTPDEMVRRMVGRDLSTLFPKQDAAIGSTVLEVNRLTREGVFIDISFDVTRGRDRRARRPRRRRSQRGRARDLRHRPPDAGHVEVDGKRLPTGKPTAAIRAGVGFVPEDRRQQGLVMELSIERNTSLTQPARARPRRRHPLGRRERAGRRLGHQAPAQVPPPRGRGRDPLGRQPAEGRAGQVARPRTRSC